MIINSSKVVVAGALHGPGFCVTGELGSHRTSAEHAKQIWGMMTLPEGECALPPHHQPQTRTRAIFLISLTSAALANSAAHAS